jgi:hypothetical protein
MNATSPLVKSPKFCKGKVVPVHAMKVYGGSRGRAPLILKPSTRWDVNGYLHGLAALPPAKNPGTHEQKAG